jgi:hypothetical protein
MSKLNKKTTYAKCNFEPKILRCSSKEFSEAARFKVYQNYQTPSTKQPTVNILIIACLG